MTNELTVFIDDVRKLAATTDDEHEVTRLVAARLTELLASDYQLPDEVTRPSDEHHVMYPLHIEPDDTLSVASVVWNVGQRTPVHGHETWGVVGIYAGVEREVRFVKPRDSDAGTPLTPAGEERWEPGQVTVCCTTDDDVHSVSAVGDEPTVGIHVYGTNIGTINRRTYDPDSGAVRWFVSGWDAPAGADGVPTVRSSW